MSQFGLASFSIREKRGMWSDNTGNAKIKGDLKILNGYENIDSNIFFEIKESKITRGHTGEETK